jgi:starch-binding outer membrane protein, SusD/RagB family
MKKILLILGFVSQLVAGCSDFFDTAPSNKIPTTMAFRTVTDVDNAVNGLYDLMSGSGYYGAAMFAYGDMKGDDMQSSALVCGWQVCQTLASRIFGLGECFI